MIYFNPSRVIFAPTCFLKKRGDKLRLPEYVIKSEIHNVGSVQYDPNRLAIIVSSSLSKTLFYLLV